MELIGHTSTKNQIAISTISARRRNRELPHMLFSGVAGCGKTSMARYVANKLDTDFLSVPAQEFKDQESVLQILEGLNHYGYNEFGDRIDEIKPTILFIDEIHRVPIVGEEHLGIAMEDYRLSAGKTGKVYWIPYFTVIGATTDEGLLSKPFRERFKIKFPFNPYSDKEIELIIMLHAKAEDIKMQITPLSARQLAKRSRGIPRIARSYLERARDMCLSIGGVKVITSKIVEKTFKELKIDGEGLTENEIKILKCLHRARMPVGLDNLSIIVNESPKTLSQSVEPFLIRKEFIVRSGKGRIITQKGIDYLGAVGKRKKVEIPANYERR